MRIGVGYYLPLALLLAAKELSRVIYSLYSCPLSGSSVRSDFFCVYFSVGERIVYFIILVSIAWRLGKKNWNLNYTFTIVWKEWSGSKNWRADFFFFLLNFL